MIELIVIIIAAALIIDSALVYRANRPCTHTGHATYHSWGVHHCYRCGCRWGVVDGAAIKHQR